MKYRNIKNGAIIDISSKLTDKNWEEIPNSTVKKEVVKEEAPKSVKKTKRS